MRGWQVRRTQLLIGQRVRPRMAGIVIHKLWNICQATDSLKVFNHDSVGRSTAGVRHLSLFPKSWGILRSIYILAVTRRRQAITQPVQWQKQKQTNYQSFMLRNCVPNERNYPGEAEKCKKIKGNRRLEIG